ncbi:MAG TPA: PASTA domain-containing protein [Petrimonas sp.]|jgi:beta-lactam-binding protein with PASTA domain|nr:PASTA domain-containing protein [Petrimonas sp.]
MSKKKFDKKPILGNSLLKNLIAITICGIALILLVMLFLHVYTRHGQNVVVPDLEGLQVEEANVILTAKGIHAEIVDSIYRDDAIPGAILSQVPKPNNRVKEGRSIYVTVYSKSPKEVAVPGLVDYSVRQATALLNSLGFNNITIKEVPSQYAGLVLRVEYRGKQLAPEEKIPAGSPLQLVVSSSSSTTTDSLNVGVADEMNDVPVEGGIDDSFF